jgi:hypothetical protein
MASGATGGKVLLGCGAAFVMICLACAGVAAILAPGAVSWVRGVAADEQEWSAFAESWRPPPAGSNRELLFPDAVGEFRLAERADPEDAGAEWGGSGAVYRSGDASVRVHVSEATEAQKERYVETLRSDLNEEFSFKMFADLGGPLHFVVGPPRQQGLIWWQHDWMILVRAEGSDDLGPFLRNYLDAIRDRRGEAV